MSRQAQFQMLGKVVNAREYANRLLREEVLTALAAQNADMASVEQVQLRELQHNGLVVSLTSPNRNPSDLLLLAAILKWFLDSKLAKLPQEIVDQAQELAARAFDYPEVGAKAVKESKSEAGKKARGKAKPNAKTPLRKALDILIAEGLSNGEILDVLGDAHAVSQRASLEGFPIEAIEPDTTLRHDGYLRWYPRNENSDHAKEITLEDLRKRISDARSARKSA